MADRMKKYEKSRLSFQEFAKLLNCESCKDLAFNPHNLGCAHVFCLTCAQRHAGKICPVCKVISSVQDCKPDSYIENLIEAYLPMSKFLQIEVDVKKSNGDLSNNNNKRITQTFSSNDGSTSKAGPSPNIAPKRTNSKQNENILPAKRERRSCVTNSSMNTTLKSPAITPREKSAVVKSETPLQLSRSRRNSVESLDSSISGFSSKSKLEKRNVKGETALQTACVKQDFAMVKQLILQGANPNTQDNAGWTPVHEAVSRNNEDLVVLLLDNGANPNVPAGETNMTPLHEAVICKNLKIVSLLVSRGADINAINSRGQYPKDLTEDNELKMVLQPDPSKVTPATPSVSVGERLRTQPTQNVNVYILNKDKKSAGELNKLARAFGFKIIPTYNNQVTHVAVKLGDHVAIKSQQQFYSAVILGHLIVDFKWIEESEKAGRLVDPYLFEIDGSLQRAPPEGTKSRRNAVLQLPGLFNNCSFYLHGTFGTPSKEDLTKWIKDGKGTVLTRSPNPENISLTEQVQPYHAKADGLMVKCSHFIIYDSRAKMQPSMKYNMSHCKTLHVDWLIACIESFSIVDPF